MKNIKTLALSVGMVLLAIVVLFEVSASIIPEIQTTGNSMNDSNRCTAVGCEYNGSETIECRVDANNASKGACQAANQSIPLSSTWSANGVLFSVIGISLLVAVFMLVFKRR